VAPADLGAEVCRVDFIDGPTLLINRIVGDWRQVAQSPPFRSLVYSAALRQILTRLLLLDGDDDLDNPDSWQARWLRFASALPGVGDVPDHWDRESCEGWIDTVVASFAQQYQMMDQFRSFWRGGE